MHRKEIQKPPIKDCFFHGEIIDWEFRSSLVKSHGKYVIRFSVIFEDGTRIAKEKGGFTTIKQGEKAKEKIIADLHHRSFVCFSVTVKEFLDYWLYYHLMDVKKIAYHTFVSYRNTIYNYIIPKIGCRTMQSLQRDDLIELLNLFDSESKLTMAYAVIGSSFKHAKQLNLIHTNVAITAIRTKRRMELKRKANNPDANKKKERVTLTEEQLRALLLKCKEDEPRLFIALLLTAVTGCRISELIALKFQNVNFEEKTIYLHDQLGRTLEGTETEPNSRCKQHIKPKTKHGERVSLLPDFVIEELIIALERYKMEVETTPGFMDCGYIWHQPNGTAYTRSAYQKPFNRLKKQLSLPEEFHWHDIRHTFATIMTNRQVSPKEIAVAMGHGEFLFTWNHYVEKDKVVSNEIPEYYPWIDEFLIPDTKEPCTWCIADELIQQLIA